MSINVSSNFLLGAPLALDAKAVMVDTTARDAIPSIQRYEGLETYVSSDTQTYKLKGGITNADWAQVIVADSADLTTLPGELSVPGTTAIGPSAQTGLVSGSVRFIDEAWTVTDFSAANSWRVDSARFIADPASSSTSDAATTRYSQISIPGTNANDFGTLLASNALAQHFGSGALDTNIGLNILASLSGSGTIMTNVGGNVQALAAIGSSGTVTNNYGLVFVSGSQDASATVTNNVPILIRTPRPEGTTTVSRAIYIENQVGPATAHVIYSEGGQSYHEGSFGLGVIAPLSKLHVNGSISTKTTSTATDYVVLTTDYYVGVTDTSVARAVTLPSVASAGDGKTFIVMDESLAAGTNNITVSTADGALINGLASQAISTNGGSMTVRCNGTSWFII